MVEAMWSGLAQLLQPNNLVMLCAGTALGIVLGILPGIGSTVGFAILLPFVYRLEPTTAIAILMGMFAVTQTSDAITSILLGVPGTGGSVPTIIDGHPMARKGEAGRALSGAFLASAIGGLFGAICLAVSLPILRPLILLLKSPEFFMLCMLGMTMVAMLTGSSIRRGLIAAGMGLMVATMNPPPFARIYRLDLGIPYLSSGVPLILVALGLFGVAECIDLIIRGLPIAGAFQLGKGALQGIRDVFKEWALILRCSLIGAYIGVLPALGASSASWLAYGHAVQSAKDKSGFGKGDVRGVLAPECANNASRGGDLIPTLLFGVPGSGTMAIFMIALITLGIYPGPDMVTKHLDLTYSIIWSVAIASVLATVVCFLFVRPLATITRLPIHILGPFVLMILILGAYQVTQHWGDLIVLLLLGILGWSMKQFKFPRPAFIVSLVLGRIGEKYLATSLARYGWAFLWHPGVIILGLLTVASLWYGVRWQMSQKGKQLQPSSVREGGGD